MALIPSESASFPDLLGRGLGASKKSKWRVPDEVAPPISEPLPSKADPVCEEKTAVHPPLFAEEPQSLLVPPPESSPEVPLPPDLTGAGPIDLLAEILPLEAVTAATLAEEAVSLPPVESTATAEVLPVPEAPSPETTIAAVPSSDEVKAFAPTHAPIPIVRIPRSIGTRAAKLNSDLPAPGPVDPAEREDLVTAPAPPNTPLRTPMARLRPRPTLQPRAGLGDDILDSVNFATAPSEPPLSGHLIPQTSSSTVAAPEQSSSGVSVPMAPQYAALQAADAGAVNGEEFQFREEETAESSMQRRRRARLWRFVLWEFCALVIAVVAIMVGLSHRLADDPVAVAAKIVTIVFAIVVAALPVFFYGFPETLPGSNR